MQGFEYKYIVVAKLKFQKADSRYVKNEKLRYINC